jgi:hypothetical protein
MKKFLISGLIVLVSVVTNAGEFLKEVEDSTVPVGLIEDFKTAKIGDKKGEISLLARLTMVYVGTAAGYNAVMLNLVDSGPSEGDYGNTYVYDLGHINGTISNLKLRKASAPKQYILSYKASKQVMDDDGNFKDSDASRRLKITLDKEGLLKSVETIK